MSGCDLNRSVEARNETVSDTFFAGQHITTARNGKSRRVTFRGASIKSCMNTFLVANVHAVVL